jgi:hypothetical protein
MAANPIINPKWFDGLLAHPWECAGVAAGMMVWPLIGRIEFGIPAAIAGIPAGRFAKWLVDNATVAILKLKHAGEIRRLRFTDDSRRILAYMLRHDLRTISCDRDGDRVAELVAHSVLVEVPGTHNMAIPNYLWRVLKHREKEFSPFFGRVRILGREFEPWVDEPE